jgi:hypothetical protein
MFHHCCECCDSCCDTCGGGCGINGGSCGINGSGCGINGSIGAPAVKTEGSKSSDAEKMPEGKPEKKGVEPPLKPAGLDAAPAVVPNVSVETEKAPF